MKRNLKGKWMSGVLSALLLLTPASVMAADTGTESPAIDRAEYWETSVDPESAASLGNAEGVTGVEAGENEAVSDLSEDDTDTGITEEGSVSDLQEDRADEKDAGGEADIQDAEQAEAEPDAPGGGNDTEVTQEMPDPEEFTEDKEIPDIPEESQGVDLSEMTEEPFQALSVTNGMEEEDPADQTIAVTGVKLSPAKLTLKAKDQTAQLAAAVTPSDASDPGVTWSSSDTSVVKVDKNGKLTAVKNGTATITVTTTDGGYKAYCTVTVSLYSDGFHQEPDGTDWGYYKNGKIDSGLTGLVQGTVNGQSGWWYVKKGRVTSSATVIKGTVDDTTAWWYVNKNGRVDTSYTGFAANGSGSWYVESGRVTKTVNGVFKDKTGALGSDSSWYYVLNSKVQTGFTGLADYSNASGWWYITNGRVDRSYTGLAKNKNGWWYVSGGKVDRSATTVAKNSSGWWYVSKGKVDRSYTGFAKNENGSWYVKSGRVSKKVNGVYKDTTGALGNAGSWYYILNSKVQYDFTGLADYKNESGWWYITNGKVDRSVTTVAKNKNGWYYVANGKVDRTYTGTAKNSNGWWYVENGKLVRSTPALVKTNGVWRAYPDGRLNTAYTGIAANGNGWWYVQNGKLNRSFTGLAPSSSGTWYVKNGKVDFSYSGSYKFNGVSYLIQKGKAQYEINMVENSTFSGTGLSLLTAKKGLPVNKELTQEEFNQIINEFMKSAYIKDVSYNLITDLFVWNGGPRWDCSSTTLYLMNYYLLSYTEAYNSAASTDPSADASELSASAMASLGKKASTSYAESGSSYPINAATQAASWGNPVYTYQNIGQLSDSNPGNLRYGDLLFYGTVSGSSVTITHVAVYLGQYYLADGDTGYYQLENTNYNYAGITEGNSDGVRISPFRAKGTSTTLVHAARIF